MGSMGRGSRSDCCGASKVKQEGSWEELTSVRILAGLIRATLVGRASEQVEDPGGLDDLPRYHEERGARLQKDLLDSQREAYWKDGGFGEPFESDGLYCTSEDPQFDPCALFDNQDLSLTASRTLLVSSGDRGL